MLRVAPLALLAGVVIAACSTTSTGDPQPFSVPTASSLTSAASVQTPEVAMYGPKVELPGGLLLKQFGKVAQFGGPDPSKPDGWGVRLVLDSTSVDPMCDQYTPPSPRGHRLVLTVRVETSSAYIASTDGTPSMADFSTVGSDGVTEGPPSTGWNCHDSKALSAQMRPSAKYRGEITVDTSNPTGDLVFGNRYLWKYPA